MKIQKLTGMVLLLLMAAGCSGIQVSQDYDIQRQFPDMQAYAWKAAENKSSDDFRENNPLLHKRFRENIDRVLTKKGYAQKSNPDFRVDYTYAIKTRIRSQPVTTGFGFGAGPYYHYGGIHIISAPNVYDYDVGMLAIDVYDAGSDTLLWRGMGSEQIASHPTPQKISEMVTRLVEAILEQFPPQ